MSTLNFMKKSIHTPKIKSILVDVGGVLVRTENITGRQIWEKKLGLPTGQLTIELFDLQPAIEATLGRMHSDEIWHGIQQKFSLTANELAKLREDFYAGDRLNTKLCDYLKSIRPRYEVAIFSNAWGNARPVYENKFHLNEVVDQMIISGEVGLKKPEAKFYQYALTLLKSKPGETILIDDERKNIFIAEALGIKGILFINTQSTINELKRTLE